jgi:hypothetical protein
MIRLLCSGHFFMNIGIGSIHGRLTIISDPFIKPRGKWNSKSASFVKCRCFCGKEKDVMLAYIKNSSAKSCGCMSGRKKHMMVKSPEFKAWQGMKARCYNEKTPNFSDYGGRGIKVCDRCLHSFETFLLDMGLRPSPKHSMDRYPDMNGNYEKSNCRWATRSEQSINRRITKLYEMDGEIKSLSEWCREYGKDIRLVWGRLKKGWTFFDALKIDKLSPNEKIHTSNTGSKPMLFELNGVKKTLREWCAIYNKDISLVKSRYYHGVTLDLSLTKPKAK